MFPQGVGLALNNDYNVTIASDVSGGRDGIGIEVYFKNKLLLEIFRDDSKKSREITLFKKDIPLEIVEECIEIFKQEIPSEYQD